MPQQAFCNLLGETQREWTNKVLACKQNLNNKSEEGTKITVWKSCQNN